MSGGLDWIPVVSQIKSWVYLVVGNVDQAKQTQINFSKRCPVISQLRSAVEAISGGKFILKISSIPLDKSQFLTSK